MSERKNEGIADVLINIVLVLDESFFFFKDMLGQLRYFFPFNYILFFIVCFRWRSWWPQGSLSGAGSIWASKLAIFHIYFIGNLKHTLASFLKCLLTLAISYTYVISILFSRNKSRIHKTQYTKYTIIHKTRNYW